MTVTQYSRSQACFTGKQGKGGTFEGKGREKAFETVDTYLGGRCLSVTASFMVTFVKILDLGRTILGMAGLGFDSCHHKDVTISSRGVDLSSRID